LGYRFVTSVTLSQRIHASKEMKVKQRKASRLSAITLALSVLFGTVSSPAHAVSDSDSPQSPIAPGPGVTVEYESFELGNTSEVGLHFENPLSRNTQLGTSFATSVQVPNHHLSPVYRGRARADGNLFQGQIIVEVCFQYRRGGQNLHPWVCSTASLNNAGRWLAGNTVTRYQTDSLQAGPQHTTVFHVRTARVSPSSPRATVE
jgi:hypothetical protein